MAVFCSESMECLPSISSRYFLSSLVTVPVAPMAAGITKHFMFHIRWISIHKFLCFNLFSASLHVTLLPDGKDTSINVQIFSFLFFLIISGLPKPLYLFVHLGSIAPLYLHVRMLA
jgi:hypothetical protein